MGSTDFVFHFLCEKQKLPKLLVNTKKKRERNPKTPLEFSTGQREALEQFYLTTEKTEKDPSLDASGKVKELGERIGLTKLQIKGWLRNRRVRGVYKGKKNHNVEQVKALEWVYKHYSKYPTREFNLELARIVGMGYPQVKKWFQSRRHRGTPPLSLSIFPSSSKTWKITKTRLQNLIANPTPSPYTNHVFSQWVGEEEPQREKKIEFSEKQGVIQEREIQEVPVPPQKRQPLPLLPLPSVLFAKTNSFPTAPLPHVPCSPELPPLPLFGSPLSLPSLPPLSSLAREAEVINALRKT